jgi:hypothetical protein
MHNKHLLLGIAAAIAVLAVAFGGGGSAVRAGGGGSISGTVYFDTDLDGQRDPGEAPAHGKTVELRNEMDYDTVLETDKSASDGSYSFSGLSATEAYRVEVAEDDDTFCRTAPDKADLSGDRDWTDIDLAVVPRGEGIISGIIFNDLNENGEGDPGEPGLAEWAIELEAAGEGAPSACTAFMMTDANGRFEFTGLPSHVYWFRVQEPEASSPIWEVTFPTKPAADAKIPGLRVPADLEISTADSHLDIAIGVHVLEGTASIAGGFYCDYDGDQVQDEGEQERDCLAAALSAVERKIPSIDTLSLPSGIVYCQDGQTLISGLPAGTYTVGLVPDWCKAATCTRVEVTVGDGERSEGNYVPLNGCESPPVTPEPSPAAGSAQPVIPASEAPAVVGPPLTGGGGAASTGDGQLLWAATALVVTGLVGLAFALRRRARHRSRDKGEA